MLIKLAFKNAKKNQHPKYLMNNGLLNLNNKFCHLYKTPGYERLSYNVLVLYVWNFGILDELCLKD